MPLPRTFSRRARVAMLFVAAMQLVVPPALTVADGYLAAAAPESADYAHIESHGSSKCPRVHDEDNCPIAHFLARAGTIKPDAPLCPQKLERIDALLSKEFRAPSLAFARTQALPRAPPIA